MNGCLTKCRRRGLPLSSRLGQVAGRGSEQSRVVAHEADGRVAASTQEASDHSGVVAMVDMGNIVLAAAEQLVADGAPSVLGGEQVFELLNREAVLLRALPRSELVPVDFAPGLGSRGRSLLVFRVPLTIGGASRDSAAPTVTALPDRNDRLAFTALSDTRLGIDVAEDVRGNKTAVAPPSPLTEADRDETTARTGRCTRRLIKVGEVMVVVARAVSSKPTQGLTLEIPPRRRGLSCHTCRRATSAVTSSPGDLAVLVPTHASLMHRKAV